MEFYDFFEDYETIASFSPGISVGQRIHMNVPVSGSNEVFKDNLRQIFNYESSNVKTPLLLELDDCYSWQRMDNFVRTYLGRTFDVTRGNPLISCDLPEQKLDQDISRTEYVCYLYMVFLFAVKSKNKTILEQFMKPEFGNIIKLFNIHISDGSGELRLLYDAKPTFLNYFKKFVTGPISAISLGPKQLLSFLEAGYEFVDYAPMAFQLDPKYWEYFF